MSGSDRYDRLPADGGDGPEGDEPTRRSVLGYFEGRFGIDPATFEGHTFWEKGAGSVWAVAGGAPDPIAVEALGLRLLRTGGRHWKPTTDGVQRFGADATRNAVELDRERARRFVAGEDQALDWDGDWGYLIVTTPLGGEPTPLGVGLFIDGTLRSQVAKARRRELPGR
ncbi:MAG: hypothetical protein U5J98_12580 [Halobacteriales archaeon]|nr:hypothetical protein [Halobacteriales archaeon]